jgi:hypothetical protein
VRGENIELFLLHPKLGGFEGEGRGKMFIFLLHPPNYPQFYIKIPKLSLLKNLPSTSGYFYWLFFHM